MLQLLRTAEFDKWLGGLRDRVGLKSITARLDRLAQGHWGDCHPVGGDVTELRVHAGPGYRVYCWQDGAVLVVLLVVGSKIWALRQARRREVHE